MRWLALCLALIPANAIAQVAYPPAVQQSDLAAVQAQIPTVASTVPPIEAVGGAPGSPGTYRPGNAVQPRITRATNCTLDSTGSCTVTWATALTAAPQIIATPVNPSGSQAMICNTTATPTLTGASIKCWVMQTTTLTLGIVTAGLSLIPATTAPASTVVQIIAIPPTQ